MLVEAALIAAGALVVGIGVSAYRALQSRHVTVARALAKAERVNIADFEEGTTALIVGSVVRAERTVKATMSRKRCVYYRQFVEGPQQVGQEPETLLERGKGVDFLVQDATGVARVNVEGALVSLAKERFGWQAAVKGRVDRRLPPEKVSDVSLRKMAYFEGRLDEGEMVAVSGVGRWQVAAEHGHGAGYRQRPRQLHISAPLHISDRPFEDR